jgi:hypothetical protein
MKKIVLLIVLVLPMLIFPQTKKSSSTDSPVVHPEVIKTPIAFEITGPLRDNPIVTDFSFQTGEVDFNKREDRYLNPDITPPDFNNRPIDKNVQTKPGTLSTGKGILHNYAGQNSGSNPPDCNGTVNDTYYFQVVNSTYQIFDKSTGATVAGPSDLNTIFNSSLPGASCNDGDPIVLWDEKANKWFYSEFSLCGSNDYMLIAVSQTSDPTGSWYSWSYDVDDKPDYMKFGIWEDGYYMATNTSGSGKKDVYVFERDVMIAGGASPQMIGFDNPNRPSTFDNFHCILPMDNDGDWAPAGTPGQFITIADDGQSNPADELWIFELNADWTTPSNSTFARTQTLSVNSFDGNFTGDWNNIPQSGTSQKLDALSTILMYRAQYRNFGSSQRLVCAHAIAESSSEAALRWYELENTGSGWSIRQQSTYNPDNISRWNMSIAMNGDKEIAIGYSVSNSSMHPGIRYCGQSSSANASANNTLDIAETTIQSGSYSQDSYNRWGDYCNISIDPDDHTFWFTSEYVTSSSHGTRIAAFELSSAGGAPVANFSADNTSPGVGQTVVFTDASTNSPTSWSWSFSPTTVTYVDGTSSSSQNPHVTFDAAGDYSVTLTASNGSGSDDEVKNNYITATNCTITSFPWAEGFENSGNIPSCWSNEYVTDTQDWDYQDGGHNSNPSGAHTGSYNAFLYNPSTTANVTKLVTPQLDLSGMSSATLTFWHTQAFWDPDQDELRVYYKTSSGGSWTLLSTYTNDISSWTQETINLTSLSGDYYIAFEGTAQYGHGVCIDDVSVDGTTINNNTCSGAIAINEVTDMAFDTGSGATASGVNPGCGGGTDPIDLWFAYTATATATATIDLCGSNYDTRLAVYDACGGSVLACNDDACNLQSSLEIAVTNGTTYYIQVGGYNSSTGTGDMTITLSDQWAGGTSTDWNDGTNWDSGAIPTESVNVTIGAGASNYPVLNSDISINDNSGTYNCKSLTIQNGGQLEVYHSHDMKVLGDLMIESGGTLLLGDDLDIQSGGNLVITGGTVANNYNWGHYGDIFFRDGSTGYMIGGTLTAYDQLEFYNTTFSITGGETHCGGTNDETSIINNTNMVNLPNFIIDADCKARLQSTSTDTLAIGDFTANAGSAFTLDAGKTVHISGDATFVSDATGLASLIQNGALIIDGNTDYQQYLTADQWHQIAPVATPATTGIYTDIFLYDWSEADSAYNYHSVVYDPLNLGEGYYVWNPDTPRTVHFDGSFNNADQTINLSYTPSTYTSAASTGFNLLGNPFPSYLTHTNAWTMTNVDATIYVWNSSTGNYTTMNPNIQGIDSIIPPSQGFYVKANAASASITIPASERTHNKATAFYKNENIGQYITLEVVGNGSADQIMIVPNENATYDFDHEYDAYDLRGLKNAPQLYMPIDGIDYSINVVPQIKIEDIYPVALQVGETLQYEIKLLSSELTEQFNEILLEDLQTQNLVNLKETNYLFAASPKDVAHRFNLRFSSPAGIENNTNDFVNIYSVNNIIYVQSELTEGEINVYDMLGQKIASKSITGSNMEIRMENAQSYYLVELRGKNNIYSKKVYIK